MDLSKQRDSTQSSDIEIWTRKSLVESIFLSFPSQADSAGLMREMGEMGAAHVLQAAKNRFCFLLVLAAFWRDPRGGWPAFTGIDRQLGCRSIGCRCGTRRWQPCPRILSPPYLTPPFAWVDNYCRTSSQALSIQFQAYLTSSKTWDLVLGSG
jgi:hypothetical protein